MKIKRTGYHKKFTSRCTFYDVKGDLGLGQYGGNAVAVMDQDKLIHLRKKLSEARSEVGSDKIFGQWVIEHSKNLHKMIEIPQGQQQKTLVEFVDQYFEFLPSCIEAFIDISASINVYEYTGILLNIAVDFLTQDDLVTDPENKLVSVLAQTYLAYRTLEELNDRCCGYVGQPLIPADTMMANLVVHHLLGEDFANELDFAVHYALESKHELEREAVSRLQPVPVDILAEAVDKWPSLGDDLSVQIKYLY